MKVNIEKVGARIATLRKIRGMTQNELSKKLNISYQAISKWERGKTLPDTAILIYLAKALGTSIDDILSGSRTILSFRGELPVKEMQEGIDCLIRMRLLLGKQNKIYRHAIDGISEKLNADVDSMLDDEYLRECLVMEAILHNMMLGYHFDPADVKINFKYKKCYELFCEYAKKYDFNDDLLVVELKTLTQKNAKELVEILNNDRKLHNTLTPNKTMDFMTDEFFFNNTIEWMNRTNSFSCVVIANDKAVGLLSISKVDYIGKIAAIGYWIGSEYWGQGITTKAVRLAIEKAKQMGLRSVYAKIPKTDDPILKETDQYSEKIWQCLNAVPTDTGEFITYRLEL